MTFQFGHLFEASKHILLGTNSYDLKNHGKFLSYLKTEVVNLEYIEHIFQPKN